MAAAVSKTHPTMEEMSQTPALRWGDGQLTQYERARRTFASPLAGREVQAAGGGADCRREGRGGGHSHTAQTAGEGV
jgi:hypothetical protein